MMGAQRSLAFARRCLRRVSSTLPETAIGWELGDVDAIGMRMRVIGLSDLPRPATEREGSS